MFSIQKFFGKDPQFFTLFEASSREAKSASCALLQLLREDSPLEIFQKVKAARSNSKRITDEIQQLLVKTFVTALDREDIDALSTSLYKILKPIEKFIERHQLTPSVITSKDFLPQAQALVEASERVEDLVRLIRMSGNLEEARRLNQSLSDLELNADELEVKLLKQLYLDETIDAKRLFIIKDLHDLLEKSIDRCRDVGNIIMHIVLKNS